MLWYIKNQFNIRFTRRIVTTTCTVQLASTGIYAGGQGKSIGFYRGLLRRFRIESIQPCKMSHQQMPFGYYCPSIEQK